MTCESDSETFVQASVRTVTNTKGPYSSKTLRYIPLLQWLDAKKIAYTKFKLALMQPT